MEYIDKISTIFQQFGFLGTFLIMLMACIFVKARGGGYLDIEVDFKKLFFKLTLGGKTKKEQELVKIKDDSSEQD